MSHESPAQPRIGPRAQTFSFDYYTLFRRYCTTVSCSGAAFEPGRQSFKMAMEYIAARRIDVSTMITHRFPFARLMDAYALAKSREDGAVKVVVEMPAYGR